MTELELRALVRDAIARLGRQEGQGSEWTREVGLARLSPQHSSHAMFLLPVGSDGDGPCLIEPAVMCNHCGYCKSYGH